MSFFRATWPLIFVDHLQLILKLFPQNWTINETEIILRSKISLDLTVGYGIVLSGEALRSMPLTSVERAVCTAAPCSAHTTCENCTHSACMWCSSGPPHCVESNSYVASFPYGQCREWTTLTSKCPGSIDIDVQCVTLYSAETKV